jgi:hypothetical protein
VSCVFFVTPINPEEAEAWKWMDIEAVKVI